MSIMCSNQDPDGKSSNNHLTFMRKAIDASQRSSDPKRKVGAIIVSAQGDQISSGYNHMPLHQNTAFPWNKKEEPQSDLVNNIFKETKHYYGRYNLCVILQYPANKLF